MLSFHGTAIKEEDIDMIKKGDSYELYTNPKFDWDNWSAFRVKQHEGHMLNLLGTKPTGQMFGCQKFSRPSD